ncbi:698_t:CDS:2 [Funneliformis mosseae]|uniref:698_t:CDS:1 n=1 Tax=Funneliformis mosseae TaxID=27381 RepID=A0A9N9F390_FUNMO|nr:698_t:CDS:2 [Funneliformis mosseae]
MAHSSLGDELSILTGASDKRVAEKVQSLKKLLKNYKTSEISNIIWDSSEEIAKFQVRLMLNELLTKMNIRTSFVAKIGSFKCLSKSMQDNNATASDSNKKIKTMNTDKIESDYNDLEKSEMHKVQSDELASEKPNVTRRLDSTKEDNTEENFINSVIHASNTFDQVQFLIYYSKLKYLWDNQDAVAYHVYELLDESELKLLYNRLVLDDENMYIDEKTHEKVADEVVGYETKNMKGESEKFNELIDEMEEKVYQLNGLPEKYHYLSNTFSIPAQHYDQSKMPDMFIIKSVYSHLDTIIKMNEAMINTPEPDSMLELFERLIQIPLFLLKVSEGLTG